MFASRRSPLFRRRRRAQYTIGATVGLAAVAALAAAAAVYLFDPKSGRRRRAALRDQAVAAGERGREFAGRVGRTARKRAADMYQSSKSRLRTAADDISSGVRH